MRNTGEFEKATAKTRGWCVNSGRRRLFPPRWVSVYYSRWNLSKSFVAYRNLFPAINIYLVSNSQHALEAQNHDEEDADGDELQEERLEDEGVHRLVAGEHLGEVVAEGRRTRTLLVEGKQKLALVIHDH